MLDYKSSLFQAFEHSKMVQASTLIPEELKHAIKAAHLNLAEILREGLYCLLENELLLLKGINVPNKMQSFTEERARSFKEWELKSK